VAASVVTSKKAVKQPAEKRQVTDVDAPLQVEPPKKRAKFASTKQQDDEDYQDTPSSPTPASLVDEALEDLDDIFDNLTPVPGAPEDNPFLETDQSIEDQIEELLVIQNDPTRLKRSYPHNATNLCLQQRLLAILNGLIDKVNAMVIPHYRISIKFRKWFDVLETPIFVDIIISARPESAREVLGAEVIRIQDLINMRKPSDGDRKQWGGCILILFEYSNVLLVFILALLMIHGVLVTAN
jgi:hypothetical protein